jgi:hypothetical protein
MTSGYLKHENPFDKCLLHQASTDSKEKARRAVFCNFQFSTTVGIVHKKSGSTATLRCSEQDLSIWDKDWAGVFFFGFF